jgi:hypothetical protein
MHTDLASQIHEITMLCKLRYNILSSHKLWDIRPLEIFREKSLEYFIFRFERWGLKADLQSKTGAKIGCLRNC